MIRRLLGIDRRTAHLRALRESFGRRAVPAEFDGEAAAEHWRLFPGASPYAPDDTTWHDLDGDQLVALLAVTGTTLGVQRLHSRLRGGLLWRDSVELESMADHLLQDPDRRERVALHLRRAGRGIGRGFWPLVVPDALTSRPWFVLAPVVAVGALALVGLALHDPRWWVAVLLVAGMNFLLRATIAPHLFGLVGAVRQVEPLLRCADALLESMPPDGSVPVGVREARSRLAPMARITRWLGRDPGARGELLAALHEYLNMLLLLDANLLFWLARSHAQFAPNLRRVAEWVGDVDAAYAVASLRASPGSWCRPEWMADADVQAASGLQVWHPALSAPVANDVELARGSLLLITGANASGKSTYLRTVGVAALMAQSLGTCPAVEWRAVPFAVRSLLDRRDDPAGGRSYFMVEADRVATMLRDARRQIPCLFLLDELFRGTNRTERIGGAAAVAEGLRSGADGERAHVVLLSTHDVELVDLLRGRCAPWHFQESLEQRGVVFEYVRRAGVAHSRTGLRLLAAAGAPADVLAQAAAHAASLESR